MLYVDSSVLLEIYLSQPKAKQAIAFLRNKGPFISAWLTAIEVPVVLRRSLTGTKDKQLLTETLTRFDKDIESISLIDAMPQIARRVREDARLSRCRSLDAIHLGAALLVQEMTGQSISFATFDKELLTSLTNLPLGIAF